MSTRIYRAGWITTDTPADMVQFWTDVGGTNYDTWAQPSGRIAVTTAKILYMGALLLSATAAGQDFNMGTATAAVTNSTIPAGFAKTWADTYNGAAGSVEQPWNIFWTVAATLFPTFHSVAGSWQGNAFGIIV